jgi:hypothetical protein
MQFRSGIFEGRAPPPNSFTSGNPELEVKNFLVGYAPSDRNEDVVAIRYSSGKNEAAVGHPPADPQVIYRCLNLD